MLGDQNPALPGIAKSSYAGADIRRLRSFLSERGTFAFPVLGNGLFPAAALRTGEGAVTGYRYVWVRDNVFVAHAHLLNGRERRAAATVRSLACYFKQHLWRFSDVIEGRADAGDPMQRPHVRFDGERLQELSQKWPHSQNDAIGYFVWLYARMACDGLVRPAQDDLHLLELIVRYLRAIRFWEDEDSGHWEETRKIGASSIGVVVGALEALRTFYRRREIGASVVEALIASGREALAAILPDECIQPDPRKRRAHDAALLFLIYPMGVVDRSTGDRILTNVKTYLEGKFGTRRYRGDSYWCADYKKHFPPDRRTADFSEDLGARDAFLREGEEAQWCIFDPVVSAIYGERYKRSGAERESRAGPSARASCFRPRSSAAAHPRAAGTQPTADASASTVSSRDRLRPSCLAR